MVIVGTAKIANTTVGHIDHAMAYLSGFQRLGHEVYLMEHVGTHRCVDSQQRRVPFDTWDGRSHFEAVAKAYGIWPRCCLIYKGGESTYGMSYDDAVKVARRCDLLFARSGQIDKAPEIFHGARQRAYFDGNPGSTQVSYRQSGGAHEALEQYEHLFTLGLNIGAPSCAIPTDGRQWHPLVRPVFLPMWPARTTADHRRFTTISTWKGRATFEWQGCASGEKSDNWLKFLELPKGTAQPLEIALRIDSPDQQSDGDRFRQNGWQLTDPARLRQLADYQDYIGESRAEFSVAHNRYVEFSTGWFSDRSALYLASARPVLVQSTGIENYLPTGKGLLTFRTLEEAVEGIDAINRDYPAHCQAARKIAEEYFDSDRVLPQVLSRIGLC